MSSVHLTRTVAVWRRAPTTTISTFRILILILISAKSPTCLNALKRCHAIGWSAISGNRQMQDISPHKVASVRPGLAQLSQFPDVY